MRSKRQQKVPQNLGDNYILNTNNSKTKSKKNETKKNLSEMNNVVMDDVVEGVNRGCNGSEGAKKESKDMDECLGTRDNNNGVSMKGCYEQREGVYSSK
nr:hypothetical protein [Tanacetum cinerariifolium]